MNTPDPRTVVMGWDEIAGACTPDRLVLVGMFVPRRPFVQEFCMKLEYEHFDPFDKARNDLMDLWICSWQGMQWLVIAVPMAERSIAEQVAAALSLRLADGVPMVIGPEGSLPFPLVGPNVYTLENDWKTGLWKPGDRDAMCEQEDRDLKTLMARQEAEIARREAAGEKPGPEWGPQ